MAVLLGDTVRSYSEISDEVAEEQGEDEPMAATTITEFPIPDTTPAISVTGARSKRRHISPRAGRALGILGHAIEYLTDEFIPKPAPSPPTTRKWRRFSCSWRLTGRCISNARKCPALANAGGCWCGLIWHNGEHRAIGEEDALYCPKASTDSKTSHARPIACQYQAVVSTAIWRCSTRLNLPRALRHRIRASTPASRWAAWRPVIT